MMTHSILLCLGLALAAVEGAPLPAAKSGLSLVQNGRSSFVIVRATEAPSSVGKAAAELQRYMEKVTGAKLPIVMDAAPEQSPFIALGDTAAARASGIATADVPLEGFRMVAREGNLFIVGADTRDKETTAGGGTSSGTLNGVYTFIEDYLDVRWLLPGPLGEDVPSLPDVVLPPVDRIGQPAFANRRLVYMQNSLPAVQEWSARQKLGFSLKLEHSHNWQHVVPAKLYDQHPDWFAEQQGKHSPVVGDRYKIETTHPEVIQHYAETAIAAFRNDPKLTVFSLSPTDSSNWSTSAASKALYDRDPHGKLSVTPLVLKFYNDVAKIVRREFPDRKLAGYIYADYLYPPSKGGTQLEPNLILVVAPSISYGYQLYREGVKEDWDGILKSWSAQTTQIGYYDLFNWLRGNAGSITPPAPEILNFAFPRLKKYGIKGIYISATSEWSQAAVSNYALSKLAWNPELDADAVCDEFYRRAYGPAAAVPMRSVYHLVDAAVKTFYNQDRTANYTATPRYLSEVLAGNYAKIESLFLDARQVAAQASPAQRARLEFFGDNLIVMQGQLRAYGFLPEVKTSPLYRTEEQIDKMIGQINPGFGVELAAGLKRPEKTFQPVRVSWAPKLSHALETKPMALRGHARFLCFPRSDQEIKVTARKITAANALIRCDAYSASGAKMTGGSLRAGASVQFLGAAGQIYYIEVDGVSGYELELTGAPYALAADSESKGIHLSGKATPLYFEVPAEVSQFTLSVSTGAPGETSFSRLYSPDGQLVETFDTQTVSVAKKTIARTQTNGEWEGFWCLDVEKAPQGGFDDVYVSLDAALSNWFSLLATDPLSISALKSVK